MIKAIGLFSGGLDSMLAIRLMQEQGLEVEVLHYIIGFEMLHIERRVRHKAAEVDRSAIERQLGAAIRDIDVSEEFLRVALHPKHGYGAEMNPCIDCKIFMLRQAKTYMEAHQAQFIFTGEVVGQRPMSQQSRTLKFIEEKSGLQRYLLRPLSAKILAPTIPEERGWVDRNRLLDISGRGRHAQIALARQYHFDYQQPAGGCLLNDPNFALRLKDLLAHKPEDALTTADVQMLKLGRHLRLSDALKIIVGRHEVDNDMLERCAAGRWTAAARDVNGPFVVIDGEPTAEQCELIARITVNYTKAKQAAQATVDFSRNGEHRVVTIAPDAQFDPNRWRLDA